MARVLYVGDTQVETLIAAKGIDTFTHTYYRDSAKVLRDALGPRPGIELTHLPASDIRTRFPNTAEALAEYDVIDHPDGATIQITQGDHPILAGISIPQDRIILGYNLLHPRPESQTLATSREDPFLVIGEAGKGRSVAYATDPVYHLCGNLHEWDDYGLLWERMVKWAAREI